MLNWGRFPQHLFALQGAVLADTQTSDRIDTNTLPHATVITTKKKNSRPGRQATESAQ